MKKLISFLLVIMLLSSISVSAFADNMDRFTDENFAAQFDVKDGNKTATQSTDVWLQVEAAGQIDATVPLMLVFKTNIDGGSCASPEKYGITNNSTAPLTVTTIKVNPDEIAKGTAGDKMTLTTTNAVTTDSYGATISANGYSAREVKAIYDTNDHQDFKKAVEGGLIKLPIEDKDTTETEAFTPIIVNMATGDFSFVTKHDEDGNLADGYGLKLLTLEYTVAINSNVGENIGGEIKSAADIKGDSYDTDGDIVEETYTYAGTVTTKK